MRFARLFLVALKEAHRRLRLWRVPFRLGPALRRNCARYALLTLSGLLAACGTQAPRPVVERSEAAPDAKPAAAAVKPPAYALKKGGGYYLDDGPLDLPAGFDPGAVPDAVPRAEPLHRFANNPYSVLGQDYVPLRTAGTYKARGVASWYGKKFHGQRTSSGEPYDMFAMTAAHPTLPIPSFARVTNPANGKSVVVRINDRGPFKKDRVIDLSYTAAWKLGYIGNGSTLVEVESLRPGNGTLPALAAAQSPGEDPIARFADPEPASAPATPAHGTFVQLGAFGNPDNAEAFRNHIARELDWLSDKLRTQSSGALHRVQAGPYASRAEAEGVAERIRVALGLKPAIVVR